MTAIKVPNHFELCHPTVQALRILGGKGSIKEIAELVVQRMQIPEELVGQPHGDSSQTELEYRLAWARTVLKSCGMVVNAQRSLWALTEKGFRHAPIDANQIAKLYSQRLARPNEASDAAQAASYSYEEDSIENDSWRRLTYDQFFAGYSEADSIYDHT